MAWANRALADARLGAAKHVSTPWALLRYQSLEEWEARAGHIRRHILLCAGLWPLPEKTPLKPRIFGRIEREGYAVEKVFFESLPGFFVCGNLYRPSGPGPFPGIACPHGHWQRGRLEDLERGSIPGRCINMARQGHVAFSYDMVGYNDSDQLEHRQFGGRREDLWGIGALSLQLWNGIRVLDFLQQLPDVDAERIGCTGASGGGTQTFLLMAVDDRVKAAAPVNMVSAHMQGGCHCENQSHLRLDINNVEIASCMAPRPLLLVSATGDWTANTPEVEFPAVRDIYRLYSATKQVSQVQVDAEHNYNKQSREAVYTFFNRHLLGGRGKVSERPFQVEPDGDLLVFSCRRQPVHTLDAAGIVEAVVARSEKRLAAGLRAGARRRFQRETRPALASLLGVDVAPEIEVESLGHIRQPTYIAEGLILGRKGRGEQLRGAFCMPRGGNNKIPATLLIDGEGGGKLVDWESGKLGKLALDLLQGGMAVLVVAPLMTNPTEKVERDESGPLYHTYNQARMACRVQDVLTGLAFLEEQVRVGRRHLVGQGQAGIWCLFARALATDMGRTVVDWGRLDLAADGVWTGDLFAPGLRALGDVRTALALCAPGIFLVYGTGRRFPTRLSRRFYAGKSANLTIEPKRLSLGRIAAWINQT